MASCTTKRRELSRGSESARRYRYFAEFKALSSGNITGSIAFPLRILGTFPITQLIGHLGSTFAHSASTFHDTTSFAYDAFGRVTQTTFPSGAVETYSYDAVGNLL